MTEDLKVILRSEPPEGLVQFIFTGLFICHLRYVANILENDGLLPEKRLWKALADAILEYQQRFPELHERFELFDLFKPELTKLCLNRNRMVDYGYKDGDDRPHASEFGKVTNALAQFKKRPQSFNAHAAENAPLPAGFFMSISYTSKYEVRSAVYRRPRLVR